MHGKHLATILLFYLFHQSGQYNEQLYRNKVRAMFTHAYDGYMNYAFPLDELKPLTCSGMNTWGNFSLTLIDSLDTLLIMGNYTEFEKAVELILQTINFDMNINVSVFETNIRIVGGLLGAHFLSGHTNWGKINGYPCQGPLLNLAENVAKRLLPAFDTVTGLPYGTINLLYGVPDNETPVTCTASSNTFALEFFALSALTGDPIYKDVALKSARAMWKNHRSKIGLVGNHINTHTGSWIGKEAGIGSGVDSYFEYLVKGAFLSKDPTLMKMFLEYLKVINKFINYNNWYFWVNMQNGNLIWPIFQSLEAFWPGLLVSLGKIVEAEKSFKQYHTIWIKYGSLPETFNVVNGEYEDGHANYPLRPEFIESAYHLYKATGDPYYQKVGIDVIYSLEHLCKTSCGYAVIKHIGSQLKDDRMESFFLSETLKYLYLLFDPMNSFVDNEIITQTAQYLVTLQDSSNATIKYVKNITKDDYSASSCLITSGGYQFNTEAHPIHLSSVECCNPLSHGNNYSFNSNFFITPIFQLSQQSSNNLTTNHIDQIDIWIKNLDQKIDLNEKDFSKPLSEFNLNDLLGIINGNYDGFQQNLFDNSHSTSEYFYSFDDADALELEHFLLPTNNVKSLDHTTPHSTALNVLNVLNDLLQEMPKGLKLTSLDVNKIITNINDSKLFLNEKVPYHLNRRSYHLILDMCKKMMERDVDKVGDSVNRLWAISNSGGFSLLFKTHKSKDHFDINYIYNCIFKCQLVCCPYVAYLPPTNFSKYFNKQSKTLRNVDFDYFRRLSGSNKARKLTLNTTSVDEFISILSKNKSLPREPKNMFSKNFLNPKNLLCIALI